MRDSKGRFVKGYHPPTEFKKGLIPWNKKASIKKNCLVCSKKFETTLCKVKIGKGIYCSKKCFYISRKTAKKLICKTCKKTFEAIPAAHRKYCSYLCAIIMRKGYNHSKETKKKISKANKKFYKNNPYVGANAHSWKGGVIKDTRGYMFIYTQNHPFCGNKKYVREHRLVVEKQIGRYLLPEEKCHHLNKIKTDNRPQNLMCFSSHSAHLRFHKNPQNVKPSEIIFDGRLLFTSLFCL